MATTLCRNLSPDLKFAYSSHKAVTEYKVAKELKAVGATWVQIDEPTLVMDLDSHKLKVFTEAYEQSEDPLPGFSVIIETYFADLLAEAYKTIISLKGVFAIGLDLVRGEKTLKLVKSLGFPSEKYLLAGVVDGRNIWGNDLKASLTALKTLEGIVSKDEEIKSWLTFAAQKILEVNALAKALTCEKDEAFFSANAASQASKKSSPGVNDEADQKARKDMVEYFGEQLKGFAFSANGWVQSYGSRCVKPLIIYGADIPRVSNTPRVQRISKDQTLFEKGHAKNKCSIFNEKQVVRR
ncbi:hypothetical protein GIB67_022936 [Kingdonia uniflora]|uniref:5-methyltetrahydropteroyltriglutamate--homocysteine S-methyltransferase n=1 Tax=Kingdonia uniflora TaxID=39325 RepID=A0A7J7P298_9MAGN|nr:hypothetical protein GIB67_022936 [Kingdonia uniflora]